MMRRGVCREGSELSRYPAVARNAQGDGVAVWNGPDGLSARLLGADGAPKAEAFVVHPFRVQSAAAVAIDEDGDFVVAWSEVPQRLQDVHVYAQRYHADGTLDGARQAVATLSSDTRGQPVVTSPAVAMDADGDFVVGWSQGRTLRNFDPLQCAYVPLPCAALSGYTVRMRRYTSGGQVAQDIQTVESSGALEVELLGRTLAAGAWEGQVSVAMAPDGSAVIAWARNPSGLSLLSGVYARRYDSRGRAELKRQIAPRGRLPEVAMDADGGYVVAYKRIKSGTPDGIYLRRFPAGPGIGGAESRVDDDLTTTASFDPYVRVAMNAVGDSVVVWTSYEAASGEDGIRLRRYAADGNPRGPSILAEPITAEFGTIEAPRVAMGANGDFTIVWGTVAVRPAPEYPFSVAYSAIHAQAFAGP